jgi:hypothetical protein
MTTRQVLREALESMDAEAVEAAYDALKERGLLPAQPHVKGTNLDVLDAADYPLLAAIWDNDDDAVFDQL